jgi:hypothetical protein
MGKLRFHLVRRLETRVKVHLGSYLISVIENNPNKNLIISISIK